MTTMTTMTTRARGQYERHDGVHHGTGLRMVSLHDYEWSRGWLDYLSHDEAERVLAERAEDLDALDGYERRYYACSPEAREAAEEEMNGGGDLDWEDMPGYYSELATAAERIDRAATTKKTPYELGCEDGAEAAHDELLSREAEGEEDRELGEQPDGWDDGLLNALGDRDVARIFDLDTLRDADGDFTPAARKALQDYNRGCAEGWALVARGEKEYREARAAGRAWAEREVEALVDQRPSGAWQADETLALALIDPSLDDDRRRALAHAAHIAAVKRWAELVAAVESAAADDSEWIESEARRLAACVLRDRDERLSWCDAGYHSATAAARSMIGHDHDDERVIARAVRLVEDAIEADRISHDE